MLKLPNSGATQTHEIAERIRIEIESSPLYNNDKPHILTVSIGTASVLKMTRLKVLWHEQIKRCL